MAGKPRKGSDVSGSRTLRAAAVLITVLMAGASFTAPTAWGAGASGGASGAASGGASRGPAGEPQSNVHVRVMEIRASGRGDPKTFSGVPKELRSALGRFNYKSFSVAAETASRGRVGSKLQFELVSGDVMSVTVLAKSGQQLDVRVEVHSNLKLKARTGLKVRSGKPSVIGSDLGGGAGGGLFVALTISAP